MSTAQHACPRAFSAVIFGPPVPKMRARAGKHGAHYTPEKTRRYERHVRVVTSLAVPRGWPLDATYSARIDIYFPDKRSRDMDNVEKSILDALQAKDGMPGVAWANDRQVKRKVTEAFLDRENPRVELRVELL